MSQPAPDESDPNRQQLLPVSPSADSAARPTETKPRSDMIAVAAEMYAGPIPPPYILREFESILPGATDRILKMAEKQAAHRISIESRVIERDSARARLGLILGSVVALALIGGGVYSITTGHDVAGAAIITTCLLGVIGTFIYGRQHRQGELERHRQAQEDGPPIRQVQADVSNRLESSRKSRPTE